MELSPKQQAVELLKKAERVLILGHKSPEGDLLGSALAMAQGLSELGKTADVVISETLPEIYNFLPYLKSLKTNYQHTPGKVIKIDTKRFPVKGMKWQKEENYLNIYLESEKNLKFEYLDIINGLPKPDAIVVLDTPDVEKIDAVYDSNTELFFEVPVINIDHHAGNEYFGAVNLVDLTATSTAEILVSLFEALGIKIASPDLATCLLLGIVSDTQSFRSTSTTPKSLTVAAQLLAAGGRQQEIITNLYKKRPMALLKLWGEMLSALKEDKKHKFAWTKLKVAEISKEGITIQDVLDASEELLANTPEANVILILVEETEGEVHGKLRAAKGVDILPLAKLFKGTGVQTNATFKIKGQSLENAELSVLKEIHDFWAKENNEKSEDLWKVMPGQAEEVSPTEPETEPAEVQPGKQKKETEESKINDKDIIEDALESLSHQKKVPGFTPLKDVLEKKKNEQSSKKQQSLEEVTPESSEELSTDSEIDVFDEED